MRSRIPSRIRKAVVLRDGGVCQICRAPIPAPKFSETRLRWVPAFHLDHITPKSKGGEDTVENLRVTCVPCNTKKGAA